jgi:preprotein translocase subunit SecD
MSLRRKGLLPLVGTVVVTVGLLVWSLVVGNTPFLGLDLQGGVAVILTPEGDVTDEQLDDAVAIIRSRVDAIGVAEPEITRQGANISVEIPGVENRQQAISLVGQTGELTFRPVLQEYPTGFEVDESGQPILPEPEIEVTPESDGGAPSDTTPGTDAPAEDPGVTTVPPSEGGGDEGAFGGGGFAPGESAAGAQDPSDSLPIDTVPADPASPDAEPLPEDLTQQLEALSGQVDPAAALGLPELTGDVGADQEIVLPEYRTVDGRRFEVARFRLGPASLTGSGLEGATAALDERGQWVVRPVFKPGAAGIDAFNSTAAACFASTPTCPTGKLAITLDDEVISALGVQAASFSRDQIVISGGFDEQAAKDLGTVLRYGALPVELSIESVQEVSASLGRDALRAGLIGGAIGLGLVALYMFGFYRLLGITAVAKLALELVLLWVVIAWLGTSQGLALTLAGVAAIVVSFGLSVDSNVVFFETAKEDIRAGRTPRSAAEKAFGTAWRTIVKADFASIIAAVLLYVLAVGPVRGFAFYLGLATVLDLVVAWFFMRPSGILSLQSRLCADHPRWFGLPEVAGSTTASAAAGSRRSGRGATAVAASNGGAADGAGGGTQGADASSATTEHTGGGVLVADRPSDTTPGDEGGGSEPAPEDVAAPGVDAGPEDDGGPDDGGPDDGGPDDGGPDDGGPDDGGPDDGGPDDGGEVR